MSKLTVYDIDEEKFSMVEEPDPSASYTYADYLHWQFEEQLELIRGKIFKMSPAPSPLHQKISLVIGSIFYRKLKKTNCQAFPAPFDVRLPVRNKKKDNEINTVVQPDLCIVCDESKIDSKGCIGSPDLIVEILSPGNSAKDVKLKFDVYEKAGVKEYWIVYPVEETVAVFVLSEKANYSGATLYAGNDIIQCRAVPGLTVTLKEIFSKK
ncbi:MAG: Uma2 family endonuclease [Bacteroidota bacterium]|nr:Uma2 family endonuclease [Bacteroidota bacterium]